MKTLKIDWYLSAGTEYDLEYDQVLVIRKIGTDSTSQVKIMIDGKYAGSIISYVAPIQKDTTNILPLLDLKDLFLVVPQGLKYKFDGSGTVRIQGELLKLDPGETIPADLIARYKDQFYKYYEYKTATKDLGTDVAWGAGSEIEILSLTPETNEKWIFNNVVRIEQSNIGTDAQKVAIRFYKNDIPLFNRESGAGEEGIDMKAFLIESGKLEFFTLADWPIEVPGDNKLTVKAKNISGSAISPPSGDSISLTIYMVGIYEKKVG